MSTRFQALTQPINIRGQVIKSRILYPCAQPHFLQGPELYPGDPVVTFYTNLAKNGAGMLTFHDLANDFQRSMGGCDTPHFCMYNINDPGCQNYFSHFAHFVHQYGSKLITSLAVDQEMPFMISPNQKPPHVQDPRDAGAPYKVMFGSIMGPESEKDSKDFAGPGQDPNMRPHIFDDESIDYYINKMIERAVLYRDLGWDGAQLDMSRHLGQFYSPRINDRTDKWGQDRSLFPITLASRLREAVGPNFILTMTAPRAGGFVDLTEEETIELIKILEPYVDVVLIKKGNKDGGDGEDIPSIETSIKYKAAGIKMLIAVNTPYMDLDRINGVIARGEADIIYTSRMMIANQHMGEVLKSGEADDLVPCIECNCCRGCSWTGNWVSKCTVNPELGLAYRKEKIETPVTKIKKVAIIGGGPGAMRCACYLADRGHKPVIFEATDALGGQIKTSRYPEFKWRLARYLDWQIRQVAKRDIEVRLNTRATPEMVEAEGFDVIIAATGATPSKPDIPGVEYASDLNVVDVYEREAELGQTVVVIGGSSTACEAAIYLQEKGHTVIELSRKNIIGYDCSPVRGRIYINRKAYMEGVKVIGKAKTLEIGKGSVTYEDPTGVHTIECDSVLAVGGMKPNSDAAIAFHGIVGEYYMIGDCKGATGFNLMSANSDAYSVAMQI